MRPRSQGRARRRPEPRLLLSLIACLAVGTPARAQTEGEPLSDNDFNIDFALGPVLGSGRIIGLGGAYTALATGVDGAPWNPATYASRDQWSLDWMAWDVSFGLIPGTLRNTDFDNDGQSGFTYGNFVFLTLGLGFQFGEFGLGGALTSQSYDIGDGATLALDVGNYGLGYAFLDGQLVLGAGARTASLSLAQGTDQALVDFNGTGAEAGAVLRLADEPWRIGVAARLPVVSDRAEMPIAFGFTLPQQVRLPWEIQTGLAWQLGPRPLNGAWVNPEDEREALERAMLARRRSRLQQQLEHEQRQQRIDMAGDTAPPRVAPMTRGVETPRYGRDQPQDPRFWEDEERRRWDEEREMLAQVEELVQGRQRGLRALSRRYLLLSAETIFVGATEDGVGVESFLAQQRQTSGKHVTVGFRFGIEGEPIAQYVKMRAGSYFEPSRFEGVPYRVHGTLSADVRLFSWDLFGLLDEFTLALGPSADVAERYINLGLGVGLWH